MFQSKVEENKDLNTEFFGFFFSKRTNFLIERAAKTSIALCWVKKDLVMYFFPFLVIFYFFTTPVTRADLQ